MASRPATLFTTLLLCLHAAPAAWCACDNATQQALQLDALLADYARDAPPAALVTVQLALDVRHANVDQQHATMRMLADLKMSWQDPRLSWNITELDCDNVLAAAERLWLPDVLVLNAAARSVGDAGQRARIEAGGAVTWISRLDVSVPVALALQDWPQDTQSCTFKFGSRVYSADEIMLNITDLKHALTFESGSWEIGTVKGVASRWQRGEEEVSVASWTVRVSRRAPAHALSAGAVLVAGCLQLAAAAALPPLQRPPLAACASFTAALWLISALVRLPGANSVPRLMSVMCGLCVCGALSGVCAALVLWLSRRTSPPPQFLRTVLSSLSTLCKLTPSAESCMWSESGAWAAAALLADRALSAALLLTLLVLLAVQLL